MSDTLLVSTRKGLFILERGGGASWRIARTAFLGDNVTLTATDPRDGSWYAALNLGHFGTKLHRSGDRGRSWEECAVPAYAEGQMAHTGDGKPPTAATLKLLWSLVPGGADEPGRLWAGTIPGGLFRSDDAGRSWQLTESLWQYPGRGDWFGGGYDWPGIHSICVDPRDPRCLRVAVSTGGVWQSDDGGESWRQCAGGMRAEYMPPEQSREAGVQDVHRMVQCRSAPDSLWVQHHNGVFRSTGGGDNDWQEVTGVPPSAFGFAVAVHPDEPDTAWFVPAVKDEKRYPVDGRLVVARTRDGGRTFDVLSDGLPETPAYDLVYRHGLAIDGSGERLAFGSTTGGVWSSDDRGDRWTPLEARLPPVHAVEFAA
ncbi:WD40/YVTN/BNR-like repeat-containing protein [Marilutibacter chinensis]|uniref:Exo-alpha-sialidase n=1 Tax=Marilutibacter chinensis TaxID=2912247 RepID=A0ABS9HRF5_9GAMM|nr:sialidase family protein [Lysobacter chinensis]MCF7221218.1 exo-alpha-sialidase [Lysobacter chinensis]MCF7223041.1 exo-alpha-sialidase [Lysobacter chinensis]